MHRYPQPRTCNALGSLWFAVHKRLIAHATHICETPVATLSYPNMVIRADSSWGWPESKPARPIPALASPVDAQWSQKPLIKCLGVLIPLCDGF